MMDQELTPETTTPPVLKVTYTKAKLTKRTLAFFTDFLLLVFTTVILFGISHTLIPNAPFYQETIQVRSDLERKSGLYEGTETIAAFVEGSDLYPTIAAKKDFLAGRLIDFYANEEFCSLEAQQAYDQRRLEQSEGGVILFKREEGAIKEQNVNPQLLYDFYVAEVNDHALGVLGQNLEYFHTSQVIFLTVVVEVAVFLTASYFFYYMVCPLAIFRHGRKTIGRAIFKIGIVNRHALAPSKLSMSLRAVLLFFLMIIINIVGFLIPSFVSLGMLFLSEKSQSLIDYIMGHYMVDMTIDDVYSDPSLFESKKRLGEHSLLEDEDFQIEQNHI